MTLSASSALWTEQAIREMGSYNIRCRKVSLLYITPTHENLRIIFIEFSLDMSNLWPTDHVQLRTVMDAPNTKL